MKNKRQLKLYQRDLISFWNSRFEHFFVLFFFLYWIRHWRLDVKRWEKGRTSTVLNVKDFSLKTKFFTSTMEVRNCDLTLKRMQWNRVENSTILPPTTPLNLTLGDNEKEINFLLWLFVASFCSFEIFFFSNQWLKINFSILKYKQHNENENMWTRNRIWT